MKKEVIGHTNCPVCPHPDAEIKEDKNGHAFIFCPDCAAQTFTRNEYRDGHLRRRMRPVTVTVTEPKDPPPPPAAVPDTAPKQENAPAPATAQAPAEKKPIKNPPAAPEKKAGGWLQPLLAVGGGRG